MKSIINVGAANAFIFSFVCLSIVLPASALVILHTFYRLNYNEDYNDDYNENKR